MTMDRITIEGAEELSAKLNGALLDAPLRAAVEAFSASADQGSGMGASTNAITRVEQGMGARISTTLNWPRTVGTSWQETNLEIAERIEGQVMGDAGRAIEEGFSQ